MAQRLAERGAPFVFYRGQETDPILARRITLLRPGARPVTGAAEAYTVSLWGVGLSHATDEIAEAETVTAVEGDTRRRHFHA